MIIPDLCLVDIKSELLDVILHIKRESFRIFFKITKICNIDLISDWNAVFNL